MIEMQAVDMVQPDICYLGGITRTLKVVGMARKAGLPVTPHTANLSLVTVFTMHLLGAIANAGQYLEFSIEGEDYYPWQEGSTSRRWSPGRQGADPRTARLGRRDQSAMARQGAIPEVGTLAPVAPFRILGHLRRGAVHEGIGMNRNLVSVQVDN